MRARAARALRRPANWMQLAKFAAVGATGYVVNLAVYTALLRGAGWHHAYSATVSFPDAVTNSSLCDRPSAVRDQRGDVAPGGARSFVLGRIAYGADLGSLGARLAFGLSKGAAQAIAIG